MSENLFEQNFWIKANQTISNYIWGSFLSLDTKTIKNSERYDKISYILAYNPTYFNNDVMIEDKQWVPYFSQKFFFKNLIFSLFGYYGVTSIYSYLFSNLKTMQGRFIYQNNFFKRTLFLPIIGYILAYNYYFSWNQFDQKFEKEMELVKTVDIESHFAEKKKIKKKLLTLRTKIT